MSSARLSPAPLTTYALLATLILAGCQSSWRAVDVDGDGYTPWQGDCWDAEDGPAGSGLKGADIHPGVGADQTGDGIDANCDDFDGINGDFDGDGYRRGERAEDVLDGHVQVDCDDGNNQIHPNRAERCNGKDDDCDSLVDDDDDNVEDPRYEDHDGDGFGDETNAITVTSCHMEEGYSSERGDCLDDDSSAYPGAPELCDGVDNDCDGSIDEDPEDPDKTATFYADLDSDGYGDADDTQTTCIDEQPAGYVDNSLDCDDTDPDVNPDATEICDGIDNDCDVPSLVDDADPSLDTSTWTDWYLDSDHDGYGNVRSPVSSCSAPEGYVIDHSDCDDTTDQINPGAVEICNSGIDDDCDGQLDDSDPSLDVTTLTVWYIDADGDSYGDVAATTSACSMPDGYAAEATDCDDGDGDVHPGATELCYSGVREDCALSTDEARADCLISALSATDSDSMRSGAGDDAGVGATVVRWRASDSSNEGILVGAPDASSGAGVVYLLGGPLSHTSKALSSGVYDATRNGPSGSAFGAAVAPDVDIDGDGYGDLFVGAPTYVNDTRANAGAAFLEPGPVTGAKAIATASDTILTISKSGQLVGAAVAAGVLLGDDAVADLAVGSPYYNPGGASKAGTVYLVEGPPASGTLDMASAYTWRISGDGTNDQAGSALAMVDDVDGDGDADLLVGIPGDNDRASGAGSAALLLGPVNSSGTLAGLAALSFRGTSADSAAGSALASAGDTNGDGYDDLIIGGPGASEAWLVLGAETSSLPLSMLATDADAILDGASGDEAGTSVSGNFDINSDGLSEILIGGPGADSGAGVAWMLYGPVSGTITLETSADVTISGEAAGDALGSGVSGLGDTDGDGLDDLVLGATGVDIDPLTDAGAIYLFALWY